MPIRFYERLDGQVPPIIKYWQDAEIFDQTSLQNEIDEDEAKLALDPAVFDEMFDELSERVNFRNSDEYRDFLQDRIDARKDLIDYYSYQKKDITLSIADGEWFLPESVESVCGEEVGNEAALMIDGDNSTFWQHNDDEQHEVILKLRDYPKRVEKLRIRRATNPRSALTNLDVYVAKGLGGLDNPENLAVSGVNLTVDNDWNEIVFTKKQIGRYIRLTGFGSQNSSNQARIREIQTWVSTKITDL